MKIDPKIVGCVVSLVLAAVPGAGWAESAQAEAEPAKQDPATVVAVATAPAKPAEASAQPSEAPRPTAALIVEIHGFRNGKGNAKLALFRSRDGFPQDESKATRRVAVPIVAGRGSVTLEGLDPGPWAIAVFHDENDDARIDLGLFGIPREGLGISRDAKGFFGPPTFAAAKLVVAPGERRVARIRIVYY